MTTDPTPSGATASADATAPADASLGQRVGGLLLDSLLVLLPVYVVAGILFGDTQTSGSSASVSLTGVPFLLTTLVTFAYFFAAEAAGGRTLGKLIVGTRVVADSGSAAGAGPVAIRTVLRVVDGFAFYAVGFFVALASDRNQRVGDRVARTRVVRTR